MQCHDDFLGSMNLGSAIDPVGGTQLHFHRLASFFSQVQNSLVGIGDELQSEGYRYQLLDAGQEDTIEPQVPFNEHLVDASQDNLRLQLADWITHLENRPFARATVNRVWAIMFGRGFIHPVDDIPIDGPFPDGLEIMVDDFVANGYDLHRLIRTIALSETFQRDSSAGFEVTKQHYSNWAVFPMIRLRPEQVAGSIIQSTSLKTIDATSHIVAQLIKFGQQNEFVNRYGDPGEDEFELRGETITQRLLMMNGEMVREILDSGISSTSRIALLSPNSEKAVETVYLATLTRLPTPEESSYSVKQFEELSAGQKRAKIVDIYWTLINSIEFVWNY